MEKIKLGFLASHGGSNMQAIVDACKSGEVDADPVVVISNNSNSGAMERARKERILAIHLSGATHPNPDDLDEAIVETLQAHGVNLLILAGYMKKLGPKALQTYDSHLLNIHPALLPKFGGQGMYGKRVHEAVLVAGEKVSGATVHLVTAEYDQGRILNQKKVPVLPDDDVDSLAARVLKIEHKLFSETIQKIATGEIKLPV